MANINSFKNYTANVTTVNTTVYTAPTGYTSIILMAQVANITGSQQTVTFKLNNGTTTNLVYNLPVPNNDAVNALTGKLVLETGDSVSIAAGANNALQLTLSVLESLN